ncbi:MAG: hypothetical protein ACI4S2_15235 [Lachnospiraceae bacterium]
MKERVIKDYNKYKAFLYEVSYDKEHKISLINDKNQQNKMYNFDAISKEYCREMRGEKNSSCDAYYEKNLNEAYLIEFKNQDEGNIDKRDINNKIHDSVATLVMNENLSRECVAEKTTVIIVYSDQQETDRTDGSYLPSKAYDSFSQKMAELSGKAGIDSYPKKFDLEKYRGILFKEVYTVGKSVFEKEFIDILFKS